MMILLFGLFSVLYGYGQMPSNNSQPSTVELGRHYQSKLHDNNTTSNQESEEWLFNVIETSKGAFISTGFGDEPKTFDVGSSSWKGNARRPAVVFFDSDLNKMWDIPYEYSKQINGVNMSEKFIDGKFMSIQESSGGYFYASGTIKTSGSGWSGVVSKVDEDGVTQVGYPKVFRDPSGANKAYRFQSIIIDENSNHIYICGVKNDFLWLGKYSMDMVLIQETTFGSFTGKGLDITFDYQNGSRPDGSPIVNTDISTEIIMVGYTGKIGGSQVLPLQMRETDLLIYKVRMSDLTLLGSKIIDSEDPAYNDPMNNFYNLSDWPRDKLPVPTTHTGVKSYNDLGQKIVQGDDGNFLVSAQFNWHKALTHPVVVQVDALGVTPSPTPCHDREQIDVADAVILIIDDNLNILNEKHIARMGGDDFWLSAKFDHDQNIIAQGTTGDYDKVINNAFCTRNTGKCQDNFLLLKYSYNPSSYAIGYEWGKVFHGGAQNSSCGFDVAITRSGDIVCVGNNHSQAENWDIVKLTNDCLLNDPLLPVVGDLDGVVQNPTNPDIFSVKEHLTQNHPGSTLWTIGSDKTIYKQIVIEDGFELKVTNLSKLQFRHVKYLRDNFVSDNGGASIIIQPGGKLTLDPGTELTKLSSSCHSDWGGVLVGDNMALYGQKATLRMTEAAISYATMGVEVVKGVVFATNGLSNLNHSNFVNNTISVFYHQGQNYAGNRWFAQNFECNAATHASGKGFDYFMKLEKNNDLKIEGCHFTNTYFNNLGMCTGISSMQGSFDVMFADIGSGSVDCKPTLLRPSHFEGLYTAIRHSAPLHSATERMRVLEAEFVNNKENIIDGVSVNSFIYKNTINWDANYNTAFTGHKYGVFNSWGWGTDVLENTITNSDAHNFLAIYNEQNAWDASYGGHNVTGNTVTNSLATPLGTGQKLAGNNAHLQLSCNNYTNLAQDWLVQDVLSNQGIASAENGNIWTNDQFCLFGMDRSINSSINFEYYLDNLFQPTHCFSSAVTENPMTGVIACVAKAPCTIYQAPAPGEGSEGWEVVASVQQAPAAAVLTPLYAGRYAEAREALARHTFTGFYTNLDVLVTTLLPAFESERQYALNGAEIGTLRSLAKQATYTGRLAEEVLFFYADIRLPRTEEETRDAEGNAQAAIEAILPDHSSITMYPNPASGILTIQTTDERDYTAYILDMQGKRVQHIAAPSGKEVSISSLPAGVYMVHIAVGEVSSIQKLIVH